MTKKTLIALKESIEHWKRLYTGTSATNENTGTNDCPLCKLFFIKGRWDRRNFCKPQCPIKIETRKDFCDDSPYLSSVVFGGCKDSTEFKLKAKIFHNWLVKLLPTE